MKLPRCRPLRTVASALVALFSLGGSGCAWSNGPGAPPVGEVWRVVELDGEPVPRLSDNRAPTLKLDPEEMRASGFTGCNRMFGSYTLSGDALGFGPLASTRMACEETATQVERAYLTALESVARWRRRDERLELLDEGGEVRMRLAPAGRVDALPPA